MLDVAQTTVLGNKEAVGSALFAATALQVTGNSAAAGGGLFAHMAILRVGHGSRLHGNVAHTAAKFSVSLPPNPSLAEHPSACALCS